MIGPYVYFFVLAKQQHPVESIRYCQTDYDLLQIAVFIIFSLMNALVYVPTLMAKFY